MQRFARVFFEVGTHQAHGFLLVAQEELDLAALHHRNFKLADLVALGQVGVEIVFAGKNAHGRNVGAEGQSQFDSALDSLAVHHRQRARQRQVHGAGLGVGLGTKGGGRAAEDLALRGQLGVGFKADDDFIAAHKQGFQGGGCRRAHAQTPSGLREWKSVACCRRCAAFSRRDSVK
jgi:hypothetical protein